MVKRLSIGSLHLHEAYLAIVCRLLGAAVEVPVPDALEKLGKPRWRPDLLDIIAAASLHHVGESCIATPWVEFSLQQFRLLSEVAYPVPASLCKCLPAQALKHGRG